MMKLKATLAILLFALSIPSFAKADALFMSCPSVFNGDVSNMTANIYIGSPPTALCGNQGAGPKECNSVSLTQANLNVSIDGLTDDLLACSCDPSNNPGFWKLSFATPISKTYNITAYVISNSTTNTITASSTCLVRRASFQGTFTVPEIPIVLLPFLTFIAILIMRKKKIQGLGDGV
jgi:hypothetical protein